MNISKDDAWVASVALTVLFLFLWGITLGYGIEVAGMALFMTWVGASLVVMLLIAFGVKSE